MLNPTLVAKIGADYAGLVGLFTRRLRDKELAADLIHDAFVESLGKLADQQIADPSCFSGFVYGVAINLLRNHRRRMDNRVGARATQMPDQDQLPSDASPHEQHHRDSMTRELRRTVDQLDARERELIRRLYLREQSKEAICRDMGLSPLSLDKLAFRARRRMRVLLAAQGLDRANCF
jgi:RNA polymerase sigma factor (sigma-70 family)